MFKVVQNPIPVFEVFQWDGTDECFVEMKKHLNSFDFTQREDGRLEVLNVKNNDENIVSLSDCIVKNTLNGEVNFLPEEIVRSNFAIVPEKKDKIEEKINVSS